MEKKELYDLYNSGYSDSAEYRSFYINKLSDYYTQKNNIIGICYCLILQDKLEEAKEILIKIKDKYSLASWLFFLIKILRDENVSEYPTYFQIRNFFEQDLEIFFMYQKEEYIKKMLNSVFLLENSNAEIYKYVARVLNNNKEYNIAEKFAKRSLDIYYKDPETHFLLGEIYSHKGEEKKAKECFEKAEEVNGEYLPAKKRLKLIKN